MRLTVFPGLMVSWKEKSWTLIGILGKGSCFLSLLLRHTQSSCQVGSWHHTSDWGNSSDGGWVPKTLNLCLFCARKGHSPASPNWAISVGQKAMRLGTGWTVTARPR